MPIRAAIPAFLALLLLSGINVTPKFPYDLQKPAKVLQLPDTLREVSGLTMIDSVRFACVQDENGILFIYDSKVNQIERQYRFNIDGDYEGITRIGKDIFVLRSDGVLFEIKDYHSDKFKLTKYSTGIPAINNEGLCHDALNGRLLIGCKSKHGKGPEFRDKRAIYGFDLGKHRAGDKPVYEFDLEEVKKFAQKNNIALPIRYKKDGTAVTVLRFAISAICFHPKTDQLYVLSALDHLLFVYSRGGTLLNMIKLDRTMFNKAEGLTFYENGDMLITNEGQNKKPTLLRFAYQP